jgi:hypothetical protein
MTHRAGALINTANHKMRFSKNDSTEDPLPWLHR